MMSTTAIQPPSSPQRPDTGIRPRRWTREEYHRAADLGLFRPEERLELLDGEILEKMSPQKGPHAYAVIGVSEALAKAFGPGYHARYQLPLILNDLSEPEPDVVVVVGTRNDYPSESPHAADARIVVEVSDTTLRVDRGRKQTAYARARIPEYWILNLRARQLEVRRDPVGSRFQSVTRHGEQEVVTPLAAPDSPIRVVDLLPPLPAPEKA